MYTDPIYRKLETAYEICQMILACLCAGVVVVIGIVVAVLIPALILGGFIGGVFGAIVIVFRWIVH